MRLKNHLRILEETMLIVNDKGLVRTYIGNKELSSVAFVRSQAIREAFSNSSVQCKPSIYARATEALITAGITTMEDLEAISEGHLRAIKGIGKIGADYIISVLGYYGLSLNQRRKKQ